MMSPLGERAPYWSAGFAGPGAVGPLVDGAGLFALSSSGGPPVSGGSGSGSCRLPVSDDGVAVASWEPLEEPVAPALSASPPAESVSDPVEPPENGSEPPDPLEEASPDPELCDSWREPVSAEGVAVASSEPLEEPVALERVVSPPDAMASDPVEPPENGLVSPDEPDEDPSSSSSSSRHVSSEDELEPVESERVSSPPESYTSDPVEPPENGSDEPPPPSSSEPPS
jgi:hypothetical protein